MTILVVVVIVVAPTIVRAQITGETPAPDDSSIIFEPATPLIGEEGDQKVIPNAAGLDILFSGSGWGIGGFYQRLLFENATFLFNFALSGRRNTDEFENAWYGSIPVVSNKVNRLFMIPITAAFQYRLFAESLQESFRPYVYAGLSPTIILQTPYIQDGIYYEFFQSFSYTTTHFRWGAVFGIGSMFGDPTEGNVMGFTIRYYTIPFGGEGLESIQGVPITNFGGVFLTLSIGTAW
jgi:hypothetical protein